MKNSFICLLILLTSSISCKAVQKFWTVADGLPTGEVQQIIKLPNGQMLIDCDGVYCLSNGRAFDIIECDFSLGYTLPHYVNQYGHIWEGDSLLWLRSFHKLFLFDAKKRVFIGNIEQRLGDEQIRKFAAGAIGSPQVGEDIKATIERIGLISSFRTAVHDFQNGLWIGTRNRGICYIPPKHYKAHTLRSDDPMIQIARNMSNYEGQGLPDGRINFAQPLPDGRYLICLSYSTLGYLDPDNGVFTSLNKTLPTLDTYRHFVGACPVDSQSTIVYTQNGAFILNIEVDTLQPFAPADEIERYTEKYNCMVKDTKGNLWIGTQNGLFSTDSSFNIKRVEGLVNNCIRSLILDAQGRIWAGTSCGISRITPTVVNLGEEDGVPQTMMMERATMLTNDGSLVFIMEGNRGILFHPDSLIIDKAELPIIITGLRINNQAQPCSMVSQPLNLRFENNSLSFQFSTLDYASPSHTQYRYRLLPLEKEWNTCINGNGQAEAVYNALQPGSYILELQACTDTGKWSNATRQAITIRPPMWLTWWAKLLYTTIGVTILLAIISIGLRKKRERMERENNERVNRLFELRDKARHQFAQSLHIEGKDITVNSEEERMVNLLMKYITINLDNAEYNVELLAADIGMSRTSLYKKMQQILGITPSDFMRAVRLKQAAKMLAETAMPINQIASAVGFQTSRNFSQNFKQMFGLTPKEYRSGRRIHTE